MSITETWLAAGHAFNDLTLWDRLCHWLDLQPGKSAYVRDVPKEWTPLLYDSQGARRQRDAWDRYEVCPVFFLRERGWCLHTDWAQRLVLIAAKDPAAIARHLTLTLTKREAKFVQRRTTGVAEVFVCELCRARWVSARAITHQPSCLITELRGRIAAVEAGHMVL